MIQLGSDIDQHAIDLVAPAFGNHHHRAECRRANRHLQTGEAYLASQTPEQDLLWQVKIGLRI